MNHLLSNLFFFFSFSDPVSLGFDSIWLVWMYKAFFSLGLSIILFIQGCSSAAQSSSSKKKIVCTIAQIGDLVGAIGGDRIDNQILVKAELNPHSYELVKGDGDKIRGADIVFYNGLGLEHGASVSSIIEAHPNAIGIGDKIQAKLSDQILVRDGVVDPHIWMDLSLWKEAIGEITEALSNIDPEGANEYEGRANALKIAFDETDQKIWDLLHQVPKEKRYLVTSHDAFQYFTRRYLAEKSEENWQSRFQAPEGLAPDGQLSIKDLRAIIDHLKKHEIVVIFPESNVSRDSIRKIAEVSQVRICKEPLFGDSIRGKYLDCMLKNGEILAKELGE